MEALLLLLKHVDAVTIPVPSLDEGLAFYRDGLGHDLLWRNEALGQAGLRMRDSVTEIVLVTAEVGYEPNWEVDSVDEAVEMFRAHGGRVVAQPEDIPIGRLAVVADPFGNALVVLDNTKGLYVTDESGGVTGVSHRD
jgi:predicted enzyme related to lactoylglutathione lyase